MLQGGAREQRGVQRCFEELRNAQLPHLRLFKQQRDAVGAPHLIPGAGQAASRDMGLEFDPLCEAEKRRQYATPTWSTVPV